MKDKTYVETPPEIIDFIERSVAELVRKHFNADMEDPNVTILDPCAGEGQFFLQGFKSGELNNNMNLESWELHKGRYDKMVENYKKAGIKAKTMHGDMLLQETSKQGAQDPTPHTCPGCKRVYYGDSKHCGAGGCK